MRRSTLLLPLLLVALIADAGAAAKQKKKPVAAPAEGSDVGQRVPAFEAQGTRFAADGSPTTVALGSRKHARPTAYVFVGTRCGTTARYLGRLAALEQAYAGKVDFVYLYPNKTDSSEEKAAFHKQHALRGPMVDDAGAKIARQLGGERTAEVVLTRKDGVVVYRGAIDDNKDEANVTRKHLALAMDEHLAGKPVSQPKTIGTA